MPDCRRLTLSSSIILWASSSSCLYTVHETTRMTHSIPTNLHTRISLYWLSHHTRIDHVNYYSCISTRKHVDFDTQLCYSQSLTGTSYLLQENRTKDNDTICWVPTIKCQLVYKFSKSRHMLCSVLSLSGPKKVPSPVGQCTLTAFLVV